jgi:hypothetical protein
MNNAKTELLDRLEDISKRTTLLCAHVLYSPGEFADENTKEKVCVLPVNFTEKQYNEFLASLDFVYDPGYGTQHIYGTVWFEDNSWMERMEYDGSEWWRHVTVPPINKLCLQASSN